MQRTCVITPLRPDSHHHHRHTQRPLRLVDPRRRQRDPLSGGQPLLLISSLSIFISFNFHHHYPQNSPLLKFNFTFVIIHR